MEIESISISKQTYGPNMGKFQANISLKGGSTYPADIKIGIPVEALLPIVSIIEQAVAESMRRSAEEFTAAVQTSLEHKEAVAVLESPPAQELYDDVPF